MVKIKVFYGLLPDNENESLNDLHNSIFKVKDNLNEKLSNKNNSITLIAYKENEVVGYKIGYKLTSAIFYSWLGGVKEQHRNYGVAQKLIDEQIKLLKEKGYNKVQTKTFNRWKSMLILNIKNDFHITDCYKDHKNDTAIILEKEIL